MSNFVEFPKIARLSRDITITEKLDGTNAAVQIVNEELLSSNPDFFPTYVESIVKIDKLAIYAQSRTRLITPENDNYGFAKWVRANAEELAQLGEGVHFGEWWGNGIQRGYGLTEKRFSLFNSGRWFDLKTGGEFPVVPEGMTPAPTCCHVVPVLYHGVFSEEAVCESLMTLKKYGSTAAPGFMRPEGIVIWHEAARIYFKKTIEKDNQWKGSK